MENPSKNLLKASFSLNLLIVAYFLIFYIVIWVVRREHSRHKTPEMNVLRPVVIIIAQTFDLTPFNYRER